MGPEQLAAGINSLRADEGYVDSASFPATPAPSPFSPSPGQVANFTPDQVAEGIQRLCDEGGVASVNSGSSSAQPPTPSTTPGPAVLAAAAAGQAVGGLLQQQQQHLGVIPEHLAQGIAHLRTRDEGLESGSSNPATPIPTPISPSPATGGRASQQLPPEQLAAGIHRLKAEEGMSSGGSSDFPSTPAPTPFHPNPGGVRPEDLAAGISRLSVIEEADATQPVPTDPAAVGANTDMVASSETSTASQPDLSQYFGAGSGPAGSKDAAKPSEAEKSFFDQINDPQDPSLLHSCRESRIDLTSMGSAARAPPAEGDREAKIEVVEQSHDDASSLRKRQNSERTQSVSETKESEPSVCTIFRKEGEDGEGEMQGEEEASPFDSVAVGGGGDKVAKKELELNIKPASTAASSDYSTPVAPTPNVEQQPEQQQQQQQQHPMGYSTYVPSGLGSLESGAAQLLSPPVLQQQQQQQQQQVVPEAQVPLQPANNDLVLPDEALGESEEEDEEARRRSQAWPPNRATAQILQSVAASAPGTFYPDRATLTMPGVVMREELADPVRSLVAHYRGEQEAAKRQVGHRTEANYEQITTVVLIHLCRC